MITQQKLMKMNNPIWIERSLKVMIYWISNQIDRKTKIKYILFKVVKI